MAKKLKFQSPAGMRDILPEDQPSFQRVMRVSEEVAGYYGFERIDTPVLEQAELFEKGTGAATDIVEKEMYTLKTRGGDLLALRPEFTPSIVRAYFEHGMVDRPHPIKLYTSGPVFRGERQQAGRYRQFHQFDLEVFGEESAAIDAQVIQVFFSVLSELKLGHLIVEVNSIGDSQCRPYYKKLLANYLRPRQQSLCADCRRRLKTNVLRVLDCKEEKCQRVKAQAPQIIDHLCEECKSHFRSLLEFLDEADLPYHLDPYLVRGLDYYTKTVFEIFSESVQTVTEDGERVARNALVAGGRYDNLSKLLGNKEVPATGGAAGVERIAEAMRAAGVPSAKEMTPKVFLAQLGDLPKKKSLLLAEAFRKAKIPIAESFGKDALRSQLARADKLGVEYTLILGQREVLDNQLLVRRMDTGEQESVPLEKAVEEIKSRLKGRQKK